MNYSNKISIVLSTYNGKKYLQKQLDSLESQTDTEFELIIRDDGSVDKTYDLLNNFVKSSSLHVKILPKNTNSGVKKSFEFLAREAIESGSSYIMFCDQDDIWNADKVEKTLQKMQELENLYPNTPLLVHTDLQVVDEDLNLLANSFWHYQNIDPTKDSLNRALMQNVVTGCTMMINRKLALLSLPIADEAIMHDWWIALVAAQFGHIGYIDDQTMQYRQHGTNDTGAKNYGWGYFIKKFRERPSLDRYVTQAEKFLYMYEDKLDDNSKEMLLVLKDFNSYSKFKKIKVIIKYKLWKNGFIRNIGLLVNA